jgi:hypothetical protein
MANKFFTSIKARYFGATSSTAVDIGVDGDDEPRVKIDAGGRITWGSGAVAGDVTLYRDSTNVLKTDDAFKAFELFVGGVEIVASGANDGDVLTYDAGDGVWEPAPSSGGGGGAFNLDGGVPNTNYSQTSPVDGGGP